MKNLLNEKPKEVLQGRLALSMSFVKDEDIHGKKILDIGCGFGWCEINFIKRGAEKITGTEISLQDLKIGKENVQDSRVDFLVGSAIDLPFPADSFDTVVSWEVIEHIPHRTERKMFCEIARVLKPGGVLYLSTPNFSFFSNLFDPAWWLIAHRHYTPNMLKSYAKKSGLNLEESMVRGGWWSIIMTLNMYISKWILRRKPLAEKFLAEKEHTEYQLQKGFVNTFVKFRKS